MNELLRHKEHQLKTIFQQFNDVSEKVDFKVRVEGDNALTPYCTMTVNRLARQMHSDSKKHRSFAALRFAVSDLRR